MKNIVIVGASSGIGWQLAKEYSNHGYTVGATAPWIEPLHQLQNELPNPSHIKTLDLAKPEAARLQLAELTAEMGGMDVLILNAAIDDPTNNWEKEIAVVNVNIAGFTAVANWAVEYFIAQGDGHLVGVSSVASVRGRRINTAYSASKAYISKYLQGLRQRSIYKKQGITITEICPGFVATPMTKDNDHMFWVASPEKAAKQIYQAVNAKKHVAYITKRWWLMAKVVKHLPDFVWLRI